MRKRLEDADNILLLWLQIYVLCQWPIHVHVVKANISAKFTIFPVSLIENNGLKPTELKMVEAVIEENVEVIAEHWNRFFNKLSDK